MTRYAHRKWHETHPEVRTRLTTEEYDALTNLLRALSPDPQHPLTVREFMALAIEEWSAQGHEVVAEVLRSYDIPIGLFVLAAAREWKARRVPESQQGVKITVDRKTIVVDLESILALYEATDAKGDHYLEMSHDVTDPALSRAYKQEASRFKDACLWLHQVIQAGGRRYQVIEDGIRSERHRFKANAPKDLLDNALHSRRPAG